MASDQRRSELNTAQAGSACVAAICLLLSVGCANLKSPKFLQLGSMSDASATDLTQPQVELKVAFARASERRGDFEHAAATYNELIEKNLGTAEIHHRLALIHDRMGESEKAEIQYLESLKLQPDEAKVLCDYGYSLYLRESWEAAEAQFTAAIESDPQYLRSRVNLGMLMARTGRYDEAVSQFAIGGLSEGETHHNVALAAAESGDTDTATVALKMSHQVDQGRTSNGDHHALGKVVERIAARKAVPPSSQTPATELLADGREAASLSR